MTTAPVTPIVCYHVFRDSVVLSHFSVTRTVSDQLEIRTFTSWESALEYLAKTVASDAWALKP